MFVILTELFMRALTQPSAAVWMLDCAVSQSMVASSSSRQFNPSSCHTKHPHLNTAIVGVLKTVRNVYRETKISYVEKPKGRVVCTDKKKIYFSSYIRKLRWIGCKVIHI
jgi:hypothetical protein